ncbi:MAG: transposase [Methylococcaceae bacterium]|jgi:hypothetical protein
MSALAMMFFQDPSLLEFQQALQDATNNNNLKTIFSVDSIPKESQIRTILDIHPYDPLLDVFSDFFMDLQRGKHLMPYRFLSDYYLITLDGSEYFSSEKIHCDNCLTKKTKGDGINYHHQILQPALVYPGIKKVIPLAPEFIRNTDGTAKQDCEINAGKRIIIKIRKAHRQLKMIIVADSLYSKQPFIEDLKEQRFSFILVAKPNDHKVMMKHLQGLKELRGLSQLTFTDEKGRQHLYEWENDVALNGNKNSIKVNYFEYSIIVNGKVTFHYSWVTDIPIKRANVAQLVKAGRARWKIENEGFNTLKNQGYHIKHNFGHGQQYLSEAFFVLNLIAFFMHQIFELTDRQYRKCRAKFSARIEHFSNFRSVLRYTIFHSWEHLLIYIHAPPVQEFNPNL